VVYHVTVVDPAAAAGDRVALLIALLNVVRKTNCEIVREDRDRACTPVWAFARIAGARCTFNEAGAAVFGRLAICFRFTVGSTSRVRGCCVFGLLRFCCGRVGRRRLLLRGFCCGRFAGGFAAGVDFLFVSGAPSPQLGLIDAATRPQGNLT
jgi:hypothetical protein